MKLPPCARPAGSCYAAYVTVPVYRLLTDVSQYGVVPQYNPCDYAWAATRSFACKVPVVTAAPITSGTHRCVCVWGGGGAMHVAE